MKTAVISLAALASLVAAAPQARPTTTSKCDITLCADYINSCGMMYGGCYPACPGLPTPTFTPPPCPTTKKTTTTTKTTKRTTIKTTKTTTSKRPCQTICVDAVNECGIRYGGCYCSDLPFPYPKPPCPSKTTTTPVVYPTTGPVKKYCGGMIPGRSCDEKAGEICIDDPQSPCGIAVDCLGICVVPEFCGGFAGFQCSKKTDVCIDDPRDDCSPATGGADCGGLCVPKSWT